MSDTRVYVTEIESIQAHPNADSLDLAVVGGWQFCVKKGEHRAGEKVVYMAPDTVLTQDVAEMLGVWQYTSKGRIKAIKLRGEPSYGLVLPVPDPKWDVGLDVADYYHATKWEPPARGFQGATTLFEDAMDEDAFFPRYTDIENMRNYMGVFQQDDLCAITEKIHGQSNRCGMVNGVWMAGVGKGRRRKPLEECVRPDSAWCWLPMQMDNVRRMIEYLGNNGHPQVIVYGEVYGPGVQKGFTYGEEKVSWRCFDIMLDGKYLNRRDLIDLWDIWGIPHVPFLGTGPFDIEKVKRLASGLTTVDDTAGHIREGVVVTSWDERSDPRIGRVILKYVNDQYLTGKFVDQEVGEA